MPELLQRRRCSCAMAMLSALMEFLDDAPSALCALSRDTSAPPDAMAGSTCRRSRPWSGCLRRGQGRGRVERNASAPEEIRIRNEFVRTLRAPTNVIPAKGGTHDKQQLIVACGFNVACRKLLSTRSFGFSSDCKTITLSCVPACAGMTGEVAVLYLENRNSKR